MVRPRGVDYECRPIPTKLSPPVGPNLMMDLSNHAETIADHAAFVWHQIPKLIGGELQHEPGSNNLTEAWGVLFHEDWHWTKIGWILALVFFIPSLLFLTLWATLKKDIQGAAGIASWWITGATILVGLVGTYS
jgi:hypothetical protein